MFSMKCYKSYFFTCEKNGAVWRLSLQSTGSLHFLLYGTPVKNRPVILLNKSWKMMRRFGFMICKVIFLTCKFELKIWFDISKSKNPTQRFSQFLISLFSSPYLLPWQSSLVTQMDTRNPTSMALCWNTSEKSPSSWPDFIYKYSLAQLKSSYQRKSKLLICLQRRKYKNYQVL